MLVAGIFGDQCHVIAAVHLSEVSQLGPAEAALECEEASLHRLVREVPQPVLQHPLVIRADRPDEDQGSVWKALEHRTRVAPGVAGVCASRHTGVLASRS